jgi:hypothetical protein
MVFSVSLVNMSAPSFDVKFLCNDIAKMDLDICFSSGSPKLIAFSRQNVPMVSLYALNQASKDTILPITIFHAFKVSLIHTSFAIFRSEFMIFNGQLFYKSGHKTPRAFLSKAVRWTGRDLNPLCKRAVVFGQKG